LIGGVSTLLFNGNPLLRFDGYYIFSDLVEIPNLGTRANAYFFHVIQKHLFKIDGIDSPLADRGEAKWLITYALMSFVYRMMVSIGIALFLATRLFAIGLLMAFWAFGTIAILPLFKGMKFLATNARLRGRRRRAFAVVGGLMATAWIIFFMIPLPYATVAEGVVIVPDQAEVRAKTEGFVKNVLTAPGSSVSREQPLVVLEDPTLDAQVAVIAAQLEEARQRLDGVRQLDRVQAEMFEDQAAHLADKLRTFRDRRQNLTVVAEQPGQFIMAGAENLPGRLVKRGELLGYVIPDNNVVVRTVAHQSDVDLIHQRTTRVEAHVVEDLDRPIAARILREVPAAQQDVPSLALTTRGGGSISLDPSKTQRPQALFSLFQLDIELLDPMRIRTQGSRVYVRFVHADEAIAWRVLRSLRQFFLGQFRV
jgi:putative peptide zinc metalloprotease protein